MKVSKKKILSLFSCGGGMDIGFEGGFKVLKSTLNKDIASDWIASEDDNYYVLKESCFETIFANDIVDDAKTVWVDYFNRKRGRDVSDIYHVRSIVDIVKEYNEGNTSVLPSEVDVVIGGFPCQDFSVAGKRKGFDSHKDHTGGYKSVDVPTEETRGKLYMWMKQVIEITLPYVFIAENVKGLANLGNVKDIIQSDFAKSGGDGYFVFDPQVLHAGRYGVPQSRERIFFIGIRKSALKANALKELHSLEFQDKYSPYPTPTHMLQGDKSSLFSHVGLLPSVSSGCALLDLEEPQFSEDPSHKAYSRAKFMGNHCQGQKEVNLNDTTPIFLLLTISSCSSVNSDGKYTLSILYLESSIALYSTQLLSELSSETLNVYLGNRRLFSSI